jgi:DNA repair/transcription protein MET18/MMS19
MEETERLVRTWISTGREDEINSTVSSTCTSMKTATGTNLKSYSGIANGQSSLLNVVKALGEYLTSDEDVLRAKGMYNVTLVHTAFYQVLPRSGVLVASSIAMPARQDK